MQNSLSHHGIKGQRWGVRRFQNEDGSLTDAGARRYETNADGTASLKKSYRARQVISGAVNVYGATYQVLKAKKLFAETRRATPVQLKLNKKTGVFGESRFGSVSEFFKNNKKAMLTTAMATLSVSLAVRNFVNANKNKKIGTANQETKKTNDKP